MDEPLETRVPSVGLFGEFGVGNIGNDASCLAVLDLLRDLPGELSVVAIARDPERARERLGIETLALERVTPGGRGGERTPRGGRARQDKAADLVHLMSVVGRFDAVVVPGTGVLEARHGRNPGGVIVWLFILSTACRLRRVSLAWFALGGSPMESRVPALTAAWAARGAVFRSYRDDVTRATLKSAGLDVAGDRVGRDVVFSRAVEQSDSQIPPRRVTSVAVAVIDYVPTGVGRRSRRRSEPATSAG